MTDTEKRIAWIEAAYKRKWLDADVIWLIAELRASQAECKRLEEYKGVAHYSAHTLTQERDSARAQLAEAVEWLRRFGEGLNRDERHKLRSFLARVTK